MFPLTNLADRASKLHRQSPSAYSTLFTVLLETESHTRELSHSNKKFKAKGCHFPVYYFPFFYILFIFIFCITVYIQHYFILVLGAQHSG